jgi:hypothetical protein
MGSIQAALCPIPSHHPIRLLLTNHTGGAMIGNWFHPLLVWQNFLTSKKPQSLTFTHHECCEYVSFQNIWQKSFEFTPPVVVSIAYVQGWQGWYSFFMECWIKKRTCLRKSVLLVCRELQKATHNFTALLGQGSFGPVYKATMKPLGTNLAVKVLAKHSKQGDAEFQTEVPALPCVFLISHVHYWIACTQWPADT